MSTAKMALDATLSACEAQLSRQIEAVAALASKVRDLDAADLRMGTHARDDFSKGLRFAYINSIAHMLGCSMSAVRTAINNNEI